MAKYIKIEKNTIPSIEYPAGSTSVRVFCSPEQGLSDFQDEAIKTDDRVMIYEIPTPVGGGDGMSPYTFLMFVSLNMSIALVAKGFFDELGRELAKALVKKFKKLKKPGEIYIMLDNYEISFLAPSNLSEEECDVLSEKLNEYLENLQDAEKLTSVLITFDKSNKKIIVISDLPK